MSDLEHQLATVDDVRRAGAAVLRSAGRSAARSALRRGGERVARLDKRPRSRRMLLLAVPRVLPKWLDANAAIGLDATFELRLLDPSARQADSFSLRISEQRCTVSTGVTIGPGAVVTIGAQDAIRLAAGDVGWPELMSSGRLVLTGDPFLALRFPTLFRLPTSAS